MTDLHRIPHVYAEAFELLGDKGATHRATGRSTGKPSSRPPGGTDRQLRVCVVDCARAISDATWHLGHHQLPTKPWRPLSFVQDGKRITDLGIAWREVASRVACSGCEAIWDGEATPHTPQCSGRPEEILTLWIEDRWAPAGDDLSILVPHPHQITNVCSRLRGSFGLLETRGLVGHGEDPDPHVASALRAVRRARGALGRAGLWERPHFRVECGNCGGTGSLRKQDPPRCGPCGKYLERNGRERPQALWHAA